MKREVNFSALNWQSFKTVSHDSDFIKLSIRSHCYGCDDNPDYLRDFRLYCLDFFRRQKEAGSVNLLKRFLVDSRPITIIFKYLFAIERIVNNLGSIDRFGNDYPYVYEACSDLECAVQLFDQGFTKSSFQMLRAAIEEMISHAYLCVRPIDDEKELSILDLQPIHFSGKNGMIDLLSQWGFLNKYERMKSISVYKDLSKIVHSRIEVIGLDFYTELDIVLPRVFTFSNWLSKFESIAFIMLSSILKLRR